MQKNKDESEVKLKMTYVVNPYMGTEPFVYFSFAREDTARAMEIIEHMKDDGFRVWFRWEGIAKGSNWRTVFTEKIPACRVFIALASESYFSDDWCMEEYSYANEIGRKAIAIARSQENALNGAQCIEDDEGLYDRLYGVQKMKKCRSLVMDYSFISDIIAHVDDGIDDDETGEIQVVDMQSLKQEEFMRLEAGDGRKGEELFEAWASVNMFEKCMLCALAKWNERILMDLSCDVWFGLNKSAPIFDWDAQGNVSFKKELQDKLHGFYMERYRKEMEKAIEIVVAYCMQNEREDASAYACAATMAYCLEHEEDTKLANELHGALSDAMLRLGLSRDEEACASLYVVLCQNAGKVSPLLLANAHVARHVALLCGNEAQQATICLEKALAIREKELGKQHPLVAKTHAHLANALRRQGDFPQALEHSETALASLEQSLGKEDPETLDAMYNVAEILKPLGEPEKSIQMNEDVLAKLEELKDFDHMARHASWKSKDIFYDAYVEEYFNRPKEPGMSGRDARIVNASMSIAQARIARKEFPLALKALALAKRSFLFQGRKERPFLREIDDKREASTSRGMSA